MPVSSPSRLALFVTSLVGGGAERVTLTLAASLAEQGYTIDLLVGRKEGALNEQIPEAVHVIDLGVCSARQLLPTVLTKPRAARGLASTLLHPKAPWILGAVPALMRYLHDRHPTALLSVRNYANIAALLARRLDPGSPTRLVISVHNHLTVAAAQARKAYRRNFPRLARSLYPEADRIVTVSNGVADDLVRSIGLPQSRITTVYNPVFHPKLLAQARAALDHGWFEPDAPPVVIGIGKLTAQKNFACLIRAFARVRATRPARLLILGEGRQREALVSLIHELGIGDAVSLPGFVANPFAYLGQAAVFVLSSAWEGLSNVVVEALACGCPVVSTDCPSGPAEILAGGKYGRLVPVGDAAALARAISATLDDPPPRERMLQRARFFSVDRAVEQYRQVLLGA